MQTPITFENEGQKLYGMIHIPEGDGPWPGVVLCHGFTGHHMESHCIFVKLAREMCGRGIAVLRFDFRGSGDSEGTFDQMTVQSEIADAGKALDFLASYPGIDAGRIGLLGFSLGGLVAIHAGPADPRVKSMVLWAAAASMAESFPKRIAASTPDERGRYDLGGNVIGTPLLEGMKQLRPFESIRRFSGALLMLHGTNDQSVPPSDSERLFAESTSLHTSMETLEGADHCFSTEAFETAVIAKTATWFSQTL